MTIIKAGVCYPGMHNTYRETRSKSGNVLDYA